jgi:hypothetical protein
VDVRVVVHMVVGVRDRTPLVRVVLFGAIDMHGAGATNRARQRGWSDRLIDDLADGSGTTAALRAATEAAVNVAGRTTVCGARSVAHLVVGQHIAGANDHCVTELNVRRHRVNENRSLNSF